MTAIILVLALVCTLLAYLLIVDGRRITALSREKSRLVGRVATLKEVTESLTARRREDQEEDTADTRRPVSAGSVRTALRFNGISPDITDSREPNVIFFKDGDTRLRINADRLPFLSIEAGCSLEEPKENRKMLTRAAADVTAHMFIGKAWVTDDTEAVIFSAEFICDSYTYLRDNLKHYLQVLNDARRNFFNAYEALKEKQKGEREAVFSGRCFIQEPNQNKIQS